MSHSKERKEKICLNCAASLYGRYCHVCGQENLEPKESVWHLITHFFNDITHFDGKFFSTGKYLITKPGFLSVEYMNGRRASYLNPIRMYVFTSAIFFLLLFSLPGGKKLMEQTTASEQKNSEKKGIKDWEKQKAKLEQELQKKNKDTDTSDVKETIELLDARIAAVKKVYGDSSTRTFSKQDITLLIIRASLDSAKKEGVLTDSSTPGRAALRAVAKKENDNDSSFDFGDENYKSIAAYDSIQQKLPEQKQDGWLKKIFKRKIITLNQQFKKDREGFQEHFKENFLHSFPKILFFSLPFFALILKLLYIRRKNYYYADHGIFTIHVYCATFIFLLALVLLNSISGALPYSWVEAVVGVISFAIWVFMFIYLYKAMRRFYQQGRMKTFLKFFMAGFLAFLVNLFLIALFIIVAAISVS